MGKTLLALLLFIFLPLFHVPAFAARKPYIVYLGSHSHGPDVSPLALELVADSHHKFLGSFLGSHEKAKNAIFYSYKRHINGFAAILEEEEAAAISKHPSVISVFPDKGKKLHTTHSWEFMQMEKDGVIPPSSLWSKARFGEDTIIGNLDTGVWSESQSFSSEGLGPVPSRWKGSCHTTPEDVRCNRKLIGARYFNKGYLTSTGFKSNSSFESAHDHEGHGTHTLSTAGGHFVSGASVYGIGNGTSKGGSPLSRVASYKVCWPPINGSQCFDADIMAAFDMAIHDGVDVLSISLGGDPSEYFEDGLAIGSFHAVKHGITVVCSAGNSGPASATVSNVAPWILTVAASTLDREFQSFVQLANGERFKGQSMSKPLPEGKMYSLITGAQAKLANASATDAMLCLEGTLDPVKAKGKMMVCLRGKTARVEKGRQAALAGAVAMVLCNDEHSGNDITADPHFLPATQINFLDGQALFSYVNSTFLEPMGTLTAPVAAYGIKPAPYMADFSSQGPNTVTPGILKPDVTAPGVNIIAAYSREQSLTGLDSDTRTTAFITESGTSMSCPHVAGVAGLLRTMHPSWSPAAIRSAIMTTARTRDNRASPMLNGTYVKANSFNYGSGHMNPNRAGDPGLVYDLTVQDYLDFLCTIGYNQTMIERFSESHSYKCSKETSVLNLNYPSITVPNLTGAVTVTRKLKNVGCVGTYAARVREPYGVSVRVEPSLLKFEKVGEVKSFKMTLKPKWDIKGYVFGGLTWSDGKHYVRSPILVSS